MKARLQIRFCTWFSIRINIARQHDGFELNPCKGEVPSTITEATQQGFQAGVTKT